MFGKFNCKRVSFIDRKWVVMKKILNPLFLFNNLKPFITKTDFALPHIFPKNVSEQYILFIFLKEVNLDTKKFN